MTQPSAKVKRQNELTCFNKQFFLKGKQGLTYVITTIYLFNISLNELLELERLLQESYGMPSHSPDLLPRSLYIPQFETAVKFFASIL